MKWNRNETVFNPSWTFKKATIPDNQFIGTVSKKIIESTKPVHFIPDEAIKKTVKIHVTTLDIISGRRHHPDSCPIALALKRTLKTEDVLVGLHSVRVNKQVTWLPVSAQKFIEKFDNDIHPKAFTFKLEL